MSLKKLPEKIRKLKYYQDPQACGTNAYHKIGMFGNIVGTDGVVEAFKKLNCFWIGDIIMSIIPKLRKHESTFFAVNVVRDKDSDIDTDSTGAMFYLHDGNYNIVYEQKIPYTDIEQSLHLYVSMEEMVIVLLPSEY